MRVVALAIFLCVSASVGKSSENPVAKVVELIAGLKVKIQSDGKAEQQVYDKFACWCESTTGRKTASISSGETRIEELSKNILELNGRLGSYAAELAKLKKDIAENKETMKTATEMRNKENSDYTKQKGDLEQAIANLAKAIEVLGSATSDMNSDHIDRSLVETKMLTVAAGVRGAMGLYAAHENDSGFNQESYGAVKSFLGSPASFAQSPHKGTYTTQSGGIQGILSEMYETFERDLASATEEENQRQSDFNNLKGTKTQDLALLSDTLIKKTKEDGDDQKQLADDSQEREETQAQLKTDKAFLETTLDSCKEKANNWAERTRLRTEELAGINTAISILTSDEAKATFTSSDTTFIQLSATQQKSNAMNAYNILKKVGKETHSVKLSLLAAKTKAHATGHFDKVVSDVEKTIQDLRDEEQADMDKRDWCEAERNAANSKNEKIEYELSELQKEVDRYNNKNTELEGDITATEQEMEDLKTTMQTALDNRNAEHEAFQEALKDDTNAVMLLAKAIESLSAFYANNEKDMSLVQARKVKQPEYATNEDAAPESPDADYGGRGSETSGIVSTLDMIKEDMENEMKEGREEEAAADKAYRQQLAESQASMKAMEEKINSMNEEIAANKKTIAALESTAGNKRDEKSATDDYLNELREGCDWIDDNFVSRREARKTEIAGLETAKKALSVASTDASLITKARIEGRAATKEEAIADLDATERSFGFLQK